MNIMAYSRCTERASFATESVEKNLKSGVIYGPDQGWVLLTAQGVDDFCKGEGRMLEHRGKKSYDHPCAGQGGWGFDAQDSSYVCCVMFLHYNINPKLKGLLSEADDSSPAKIFQLKGSALLEKYQALSTALNLPGGTGQHGRAVHVWKRAPPNEIAIDFCIGLSDLKK